MSRVLLDGVPAWMTGQSRAIALGLLSCGWYRGEPSRDTDGHELIATCGDWALYSAYGEPILSWVLGDEWFSFDWSEYWGPDDLLDEDCPATAPAAIDRALQDFDVAQSGVEQIEQLSLV